MAHVQREHDGCQSWFGSEKRGRKEVRAPRSATWQRVIKGSWIKRKRKTHHSQADTLMQAYLFVDRVSVVVDLEDKFPDVSFWKPPLR